jgi:hypothetical protein
MRARGVLVILAVAVVVAVIVWRRSPAEHALHATGAPGSAAPVRAAHPGSDPGPGPGTAPAPPGEVRQSQVRRLTSDERRRLGEQIAAARQRAHEAAGSPATGPADDDVIPLEQVSKPLKDALDASIHLLAECYQQQPGGDAMRDALARMTMTSDPDLGTVIDTQDIKDAAGAPIAAGLDDCLRDTIDSLALPPLGKGGKLELQYTFKFD